MSLLTRLQCQNCSAVLNRKDEFQSSIACKYCGSSYELSKPTGAGQSEELAPLTELRPIKPDTLEINKSPDSIEVIRRWRSKNSYILLIMSLVWLGAVLSTMAEVWLDGVNGSILFLLVFVVVGGIMLYRALSEIFNTSTLTVNKRQVSLDTKPFRWKGDFSHPVNKIKYFEIVPPPNPSIAARAKSCRVCAITDDDMRLTLVEKLHNPGHAIYLLREFNELAKKP